MFPSTLHGVCVADPMHSCFPVNVGDFEPMFMDDTVVLVTKVIKPGVTAPTVSINGGPRKHILLYNGIQGAAFSVIDGEE